MNNVIKNYVLALLLFNLNACATTHIVPVPPVGIFPGGIEIGDRVEVLTFDNNIHKFKATRVDFAGIGGSAEFFAFADIKEYEH